MKSQRRSYLKLAVALCAVIVLGLGLYFGMRAVEKLLVDRADSEILSGLVPDEFGRVEYEGKTYEPKIRISSTLVIGIDKTEDDSDSRAAMSDFLALFVFDEEEKVCSVIQINRDTMMDVPVIGVLGDKAGTKYQQIAWAHSYGSGKDDSCRNTADAVSSLFFDVTVDNYMSVEMEAVSVLNDIVGGVEVEIKNDFSSIDPSLVKGEVIRLTGQQALTYVRARSGIGDQSNISRMGRQKEYMTAFMDTFVTAYENDNTVVVDALEAVDEYIITDCTAAELADMAEFVSVNNINEIIIPEGNSVLGDRYMEHTLDEDALMKLVIETFYKETK